MTKMFTKFPRSIKTLLAHAISLAIIAGISLHLTTRNLIDAELSNLSMQFFWGIFFLGALVLAVGGILRPAFLVGTQLWKRSDLNRESVRDDIERLIFYVGEMCISLAILVLGGFIKVFGLP
jgi:hypothetical protein